jgi:membrane protein YqaA with SNARE-associated domain
VIGQDILDLFADLGDVGMLLALVLIIWLDGTAFPTVPEIWMVLIFGAQPDSFSSFSWGAILVIVATLAGLAGNLTLYSLVKIAKLPNWIQKKMRQYTQFLIVKDERLLILNRFAPIVPYTGAFVAACGWDLRKSVIYLLISGVAKSAFIVTISWLSFDNLREEVAFWVAVGVVAIMVTASIISSLIYRRRARKRGEIARSQ